MNLRETGKKVVVVLFVLLTVSMAIVLPLGDYRAGRVAWSLESLCLGFSLAIALGVLASKVYFFYTGKWPSLDGIKKGEQVKDPEVTIEDCKHALRGFRLAYITMAAFAVVCLAAYTHMHLTGIWPGVYLDASNEPNAVCVVDASRKTSQKHWADISAFAYRPPIIVTETSGYIVLHSRPQYTICRLANVAQSPFVGPSIQEYHYSCGL